MESENINALTVRFKMDSESVYNTWFIDNDDRMKAFRSIRRGVMSIVEAIKGGTFGNDFKGDRPDPIAKRRVTYFSRRR